jgi:transmembrane sensor
VSTGKPEDIRRLGEASQWFTRLRAEPNSEESLNAWLQWCELDPENGEAFRRVQVLWRQLDQVYTDRAEIDALLQTENRPALVGADRPSIFAALAAILPGTRRLSWSVLAVAVCLVGAGLLWNGSHSSNGGPPLASTAAEHRTVTLPDGSLMDLGARTTVAVDFRSNERRLQLSPGEAYFKVQPDKKRPFVVHAGLLDVTAVGTAFDVKHEPSRVTVTVQEGMVVVQPADGGRHVAREATWRVGRGYQFVYSGHDATAALSSVDTSAVIAWRDGRLEYVNTPLASVLADVNRYAEHPVQLVGPSVGRLTFTGTVFTDSIDGWLQTLPGALPVRIDRTAAGVVLVTASTTPAN